MKRTVDGSIARSLLLLVLASVLALAACGDDDGQQSQCGNGVVEGEEACDDGGDNGTTLCGCQVGCAFATSDTECRAPVGLCDATELCDGAGECPVDGLLAQGDVCRPAEGPCDIDELCSGNGTECPFDNKTPAGTVCHHSTGSCDPDEACDGDDPLCPADLWEPNGTSCTDCATPPCTTCQDGACQGS
jgi:hypothetical protein